MEEDKRYVEPTPSEKAVQAAQRAMADAQRTALRPKPRKNKDVGTAKSVDIYVTSWCPYCKDVKRDLDSIQASYTAYDIEKDSAANARFQAFGGRGVPLVVVDGHAYISGISSKELVKLIGSK